ncbi:MAG: hypothetical protein HZB51_10005 [Chloroflexi bacterium]|nr:hypothetical protein [Chloroflexota bacterium]
MNVLTKMFHKKKRTSRLTKRLIFLAAFVNSLLAGTNVNRALIDMPAWQQVGARAWASFSRQADLGLGGLVLYPAQAFLGAILSILALINFQRDGGEPRQARIPLYMAVFSTIAGLLATSRAAPIMLGVRDMGEESIDLQHALNRFQMWSNIRGAFQMLAFVANLWSLFIVSGSRRKVKL